MGLFKKIRRSFRRTVKKVVPKAIRKTVKKYVMKPIRSVVNRFGGAVAKVLKKTGLGKVLAPFLNKFLSSPLGLLFSGPLGGIGALLAGSSGLGGMLKIASAVLQTPAAKHPVGHGNLVQLVAWSHAQSLLRSNRSPW